MLEVLQRGSVQYCRYEPTLLQLEAKNFLQLEKLASNLVAASFPHTSSSLTSLSISLTWTTFEPLVKSISLYTVECHWLQLDSQLAISETPLYQLGHCRTKATVWISLTISSELPFILPQNGFCWAKCRKTIAVLSSAVSNVTQWWNGYSKVLCAILLSLHCSGVSLIF